MKRAPRLKAFYEGWDLPRFVPALAPSAEQWQSLFTLYIIAAGIVGGAVFGIFFYFLAKYRKKPGAADPNDAPRVGVMAERGNPALAAILTALLVSLFFGLTLNTFGSFGGFCRNAFSANVLSVRPKKRETNRAVKIAASAGFPRSAMTPTRGASLGSGTPGFLRYLARK